MIFTHIWQNHFTICSSYQNCRK